MYLANLLFIDESTPLNGMDIHFESMVKIALSDNLHREIVQRMILVGIFAIHQHLYRYAFVPITNYSLTATVAVIFVILCCNI